MPTTTTRYGFSKPTTGGDADVWGGYLNTGLDDIDYITGAITTTGSANAYVLTSGLSLAAYVAGQHFIIKASFGNTSTATINVDGLGAKDLRKNGTTALASGDIVSGNIYAIAYDGTLFQILGSVGAGNQPLDATLTALAALAWSSGNMYVVWTAADTVALSAAPQFDSINLGHASANTLTAASGILSIEGNALVGLAGTQTITGVKTIATGGSANSVDLILGNGQGVMEFSGGNGSNVWFNTQSASWGFEWRINGTAKLTLNSSGNVVAAGTLQARVPLSSETTGTLTSTSANKKVACSGGITLDDGVFTADDFILFDPGTSARTFTRAAGCTMYVNGTDSASATLAANQIGTAQWRSASVVVLSGAFT